MKNRKAQAQNIFIYLLTAVITALVLFFGYKSIVNVQDSASRVTILNFRTSITNDLDVDSSFGTVKVHTYEVPAKYKEVCLIDLSQSPIDSDPVTGHEVCVSGSPRYRPVVCDSWSTAGVKQNLFLLPGGEPFDVGNITFGGYDYLCLNISNGVFKARFRGLGDQTLVQPVG